MRVIFFGNGNTMVVDKEGKEIANLRQSWFALYLTFLKLAGISVKDIEFQLPLGWIVTVKETENGWEWGNPEPK